MKKITIQIELGESSPKNTEYIQEQLKDFMNDTEVFCLKKTSKIFKYEEEEEIYILKYKIK